MRLYIDPGTGSMLFAELIGIIGALRYLIKLAIAKFKYRTSGKKDISLETIPFVIYSDDKRYWTVFEPVVKELDRRGFDVVYYTQSKDDKALDTKLEHLKSEYIGEGNESFTKLNNLNATMVLSTTPSLDVFQWKRSKKVKYYVHMLHAANDIIYRMFGIDFYDAMLLSGEYQLEDLRYLEKIRNLPEKDVCFIGIPYFDEMKKRLGNSIKYNNNPKVVLLAPSWGKSAILSRYGDKIIDELLNTGYKIVVRPHPQSLKTEKEMIGRLMTKYPELEWNKDADNFDILNRADILISDFSGIIYDFSLVFDKPVIVADTSYDSSPYDSWWLNRPMWTFRALPKVAEQLTEDNLSNIKETIDKCLNSKEYAQGRQEARKETWMYPGEGTKHTCDYLVNKYMELTNKEKGETK